MIDNCAFGYDRNDINMDASIPTPSQQTILGAMVLQIIRDLDELTLDNFLETYF